LKFENNRNGGQYTRWRHFHILSINKLTVWLLSVNFCTFYAFCCRKTLKIKNSPKLRQNGQISTNFKYSFFVKLVFLVSKDFTNFFQNSRWRRKSSFYSQNIKRTNRPAFRKYTNISYKRYFQFFFFFLFLNL
jgi:hypothetical protein